MTKARETFEKRLAGLKTERSDFDPHIKDISENITPARGRFSGEKNNDGSKKYKKMVTSHGRMASRTLASGMLAGVTNQSRPWFRFAPDDKALGEFQPVKEWLAIAESRMRAIFNGSNLYNSLSTVYGEMGDFGTAAMPIVTDREDFLRCYPMTFGMYYLGISDRDVVDTMYTEQSRTVGQIIAKHGLDKVSTTIKNLYDRGSYDQRVDLVHAVEPNDDRDIGLKDNRNMPFRSVWYEQGADDGSLLSQSGFERFPALCPRWDVTPGDVYGTDCPGMTALGDVKELYHNKKKKAEGIDKQVRPPLQAPSELKNQTTSGLPGGITYYDQTKGTVGIRSLYEVNINLADLREDMEQIKKSISRAYYEDLFLMLASSDRRDFTAREIDERSEEKLLMLGPVLGRLDSELLNQLINWTFDEMVRVSQPAWQGVLGAPMLLPPPPKELEGMKLKIEYISVLAQAQKAVGINALERTTNYVSALAAVFPEAADKFNADQAIDEYADMTGLPPSVIRSDEAVAEKREGRAQAQAQADQMAMMEQMANTAKTASEVDVSEGSALEGLDQ